MQVKITENLAVRIWDALNETGLNTKGAFKCSVVALRNRLETAMAKAGLGVPKSDNGRA